jgi:hypothetical protein
MVHLEAQAVTRLNFNALNFVTGADLQHGVCTPRALADFGLGWAGVVIGAGHREILSEAAHTSSINVRFW